MYHVNPYTGNVNLCRAKIRCLYGESPHYSSAEEARKAYENTMTYEELSPRNFQGQWFADLDEEELNALSFYGKPMFHRNFNARLRSNTFTKDDEAKARALDTALAKAPQGPPLQVFRGLNLHKSEVSSVFETGYLVNKGYSSTTIKSSMAHMFTSSTLPERQAIILRTTTTKRSFLDLGEGEILLPRNSVFTVEDSETKITNSKKVLFLTGKCHNS